MDALTPAADDDGPRIDERPRRRVRVKVCGLTRPRDVRAAVDCGVDAVGMIFYPPSPRGVSVAQAERMASEVPPFVTRVGVFVNASEEDIAGIMERIPLDVIQFHGDEPPDRCRRAPRPFVKAVAMREGVDIDRVAEAYQGALGLLLDSYSAGARGGTGTIFDWRQARRSTVMPVILAGGLDAANVAAAITAVAPYAVDVNGGVESSPGIKDARKIEAFVNEVERVQAAKH